MQKKFSLKEARKAKDSVIKRKKIQKIQQVQQTQQAQQTQQVQKVQQNIQTKIQPKIQETKPTDKIEKEALIPCPPPTPSVEVDTLLVTKVFQECRVVDTNEIIDAPVAPAAAVDVECLGAELIAPPTCVINFDNTVTVTFSFVTAYQFLDINGNPIGDVQVVQTDETRTVLLSRAGEPNLECLAEVFLECLLCFVSERGTTGGILEVTCCVGKQIVFKLVANVQLQIPTYGYAPEPPDCEEVLGECPEFTPIWPPYPPQNLLNAQSNCRRCKK